TFGFLPAHHTDCLLVDCVFGFCWLHANIQRVSTLHSAKPSYKGIIDMITMRQSPGFPSSYSPCHALAGVGNNSLLLQP
ncbi:hypothetical protein ATANTOWER_023753, partial [Ataeniobius toweri]|nr:hypothetical protein [Ataeniobius toweri]